MGERAGGCWCGRGLGGLEPPSSTTSSACGFGTRRAAPHASWTWFRGEPCFPDTFSDCPAAVCSSPTNGGVCKELKGACLQCATTSYIPCRFLQDACCCLAAVGKCCCDCLDCICCCADPCPCAGLYVSSIMEFKTESCDYRGLEPTVNGRRHPGPDVSPTRKANQKKQ